MVAPDFTLDKTIEIIAAGAAEKPEQSAVVATLQAKLARSRGFDDKLVDRVTQSMAARSSRRCSASWTS